MASKYPIPTTDLFFSLSCLNVGVGPGGGTSMLAYVPLLHIYFLFILYRRVSIVNFKGEKVLDVYVAPTLPVTDYRTATTGIKSTDLLSS